MVGALLCVPRLVIAWFLTPPALDPLQIGLVSLQIAGLIAMGMGLFGILVVRRGERSLRPLGLAGVAAVLVAGLITATGQPKSFAFYDMGGPLVPPEVVLLEYVWTLIGALWVIGLVFALGSALLGVRRRRAAPGGPH